MSLLDTLRPQTPPAAPVARVVHRLGDSRAVSSQPSEVSNPVPRDTSHEPRPASHESRAAKRQFENEFERARHRVEAGRRRRGVPAPAVLPIPKVPCPDCGKPMQRKSKQCRDCYQKACFERRAPTGKPVRKPGRSHRYGRIARKLKTFRRNLDELIASVEKLAGVA